MPLLVRDIINNNSRLPFISTLSIFWQFLKEGRRLALNYWKFKLPAYKLARGGRSVGRRHLPRHAAAAAAHGNHVTRLNL